MKNEELAEVIECFKCEIFELINENQEDTMSAISDLGDAVTALHGERDEILAAILSLTQKVTDLTAAVAAGGSNVDPAIVDATNAIKADIATLHAAITPSVSLPTQAQIDAFSNKTNPTPTQDQINRFKTNNLTDVEKSQFNV